MPTTMPPTELDWFDTPPTPTTANRRPPLVRHPRSRPPWRENRDPYRIWISEAMLQQTTVAAVKPYFARFLDRLPTLQDLADAPEDVVLRLWEGLGYYSRARNLHRAAKEIVTRFHGTFPPDVETLMSLPGIGRYTAGAIASFAYDTRAPIVEANTLRLYSRLLGYRGDPRSKEGQTLLWEFAERILPRDRAAPSTTPSWTSERRSAAPPIRTALACPLKTSCRVLRRRDPGPRSR